MVRVRRRRLGCDPLIRGLSSLLVDLSNLFQYNYQKFDVGHFVAAHLELDKILFLALLSELVPEPCTNQLPLLLAKSSVEVLEVLVDQQVHALEAEQHSAQGFLLVKV